MEKRDIKYLGKDFSSLREELIEYAKNYFPDTYTDFTEASPGMMFIEMAAYVGDILSFYQDNQVQETFLQYAKNPASLYAMAYMMGYRPKVTTVAEVDLTVSQTVDAKFVGAAEYIPSWSQAYVLGEGSEVKSNTNPSVSFLTKDVVDFSYSSSADPTEVVANFGAGSAVPSSFTLVKHVKATSGQIKQFSKAFGTYNKYQTITLEDTDIVGIISATDSDGNEWTEVPFLGQDTVFTDTAISGSSKAQYVLELKKVPRRFVTRFNTNGNLDIQFGAGIYASDISESIYLPDPIALQTETQEFSSASMYDVAYDPSNFMFSKSYGLCPVNTTITFKYTTGGGIASNVPAGSLTEAGTIYLKRKSSSTAVNPADLSFNNEYAATGGRDGDSLEEIRQNALRCFAEQKRMVTLKDFNIRALAMPAKYGSVAKVYATNESLMNKETAIRKDLSPLSIVLYVLSYDIDGNLTQMSDDIKSNLRTYLSEYLMLTDRIDIEDAYVINIGVKYDIVMKPNYDSNEVLLNCGNAVKEFFRTDRRNINEAINLTELYNTLDAIKGVQAVKNIEVINKYGEDDGYSKYSYNIASAMRNNTIYPSYDPCIFELKYPDIDIEGRVVTL